MLELFSLDYDAKLQTYCVNARCDYEWFLKITQDVENHLEIQRNISQGATSNIYGLMRTDIKRGCLLPPLVFAFNNVLMPAPLNNRHEPLVDKQKEDELLLTLTEPLKNITPENVYIIDGLQRAHAIKMTAETLTGDEQTRFILGSRLHIEIWLNIPFGAVAYRRLLINVGQQLMSVRQHIEILSIKLQEELSTIPHIKILTSFKPEGRTHKGEFYLNNLSSAFQTWLQGQPNLENRNLVIAQLVTESVINTLGSSLVGFKEFVSWLVDIDYALSEEQFGFLSYDTVLQGIAAAVGAAERNITLRERMVRGLENILNQLRTDHDLDPLGIQLFENLKQGFDTKKINVEQATREMVFGAFQEYFYSDGVKSMHECWQFAAGRI